MELNECHMEMKPRLKPGDYFVRAKEFRKRLGIGNTIFYRKISEGLLPSPIKLSPRVSVWPASEIDAVMEKLAQGEMAL